MIDLRKSTDTGVPEPRLSTTEPPVDNGRPEHAKGVGKFIFPL